MGEGRKTVKKHPILFAIAAALLLNACGGTTESPTGTSITAADLADRIQAGASPLVLDVRTSEEYGSGHIPGAVNIPYDELPARLSELPVEKSTEIVVHCQSGRRAQVAEGTLRESGYSNVRDLAGHWQGWRAAELPIE